jgi:hypothetical protein
MFQSSNPKAAPISWQRPKWLEMQSIVENLRSLNLVVALCRDGTSL